MTNSNLAFTKQRWSQVCFYIELVVVCFKQVKLKHGNDADILTHKQITVSHKHSTQLHFSMQLLPLITVRLDFGEKTLVVRSGSAEPRQQSGAAVCSSEVREQRHQHHAQERQEGPDGRHDGGGASGLPAAESPGRGGGGQEEGGAAHTLPQGDTTTLGR